MNKNKDANNESEVDVNKMGKEWLQLECHLKECWQKVQKLLDFFHIVLGLYVQEGNDYVTLSCQFQPSAVWYKYEECQMNK